MVKPLVKGITYVVDALGNKIGALPSTSKNIGEYSDIIDQSVRLDTPDAFKNIFHQDKEFAKGYGGELKSGALKFGSEDIPPSLTDKELADAQKEIQALTQDYLKDLPEEVTVYRYGDLDNESGVSSFTLNPNYNADLSLPWQKRLQSPLQAFKVNKKDILASPDINTFFGGGRTFDEQEVIISNDKVGALPSSSELYRYEKSSYDMPNEGAIFYSPDKSYAELYKADESILRTTKMPDSILDIRDKDSLEKSYNWIKKEIINLEKNEIPNTKQDLKLAKKFLDRKDPQGISSALANLNIIYSKQMGRPMISGMAEKRLMNDLDFDAITIKEAGREGDDYSAAFRNNP